MSWTKLLTDINKISAIFGDQEPSLKSVNLHEITLNRDGPKVVLRFDLPDFPKSSPKKWRQAGFNCVQIQLMALSIHDLKIEGLDSECKCSIHISAKKELLSLSIDENKLNVYLTADHLLIDKISAYKSI